MKVLVTGSSGFIGKNLKVRLSELPGVEVLTWDRQKAPPPLNDIHFVVHLAGVNRPENLEQFKTGNLDFTEQLCLHMKAEKCKAPVLFTSSTQATLKNPYGESKIAAEEVLEQLSVEHGNPVLICRLPNVFGKWSRPNYNSAIATFCFNLSRGLPIQIHDKNAPLNLIYIDDLIDQIILFLKSDPKGIVRPEMSPVYSTSVGEVADLIRAFAESRDSLVTERVGNGLIRALYATFVSFQPTEKFVYKVAGYTDPRGTFVEMLKTKDSGQFSFFTAHPGVTRGGHYHHTKTEKFLVLKGRARFGFRNLLTNEKKEIFTSGDIPEIVETIPGWTHDIKNIGEDEMYVMLWANEIFDREKPDTIRAEV